MFLDNTATCQILLSNDEADYNDGDGEGDDKGSVSKDSVTRMMILSLTIYCLFCLPSALTMALSGETS